VFTVRHLKIYRDHLKTAANLSQQRRTHHPIRLRQSHVVRVARIQPATGVGTRDHGCGGKQQKTDG
jgi:hypothetical protein